jgi:hypothetical protein
MKDQTEFEIELYNPTKEKIMAMIEMNGSPISDSGIILKPGQRVFLERFLDHEKKFLYETYVVNNNNQTKEAIQNNGKVTVKFHKESKARPRSIIYGSVFNSFGNGFGSNDTTVYTYTTNYEPKITTNFCNDVIGTITPSSNNISAAINSNRKVETVTCLTWRRSVTHLTATNGVKSYATMPCAATRAGAMGPCAAIDDDAGAAQYGV